MFNINLDGNNYNSGININFNNNNGLLKYQYSNIDNDSIILRNKGFQKLILKNENILDASYEFDKNTFIRLDYSNNYIIFNTHKFNFMKNYYLDLSINNIKIPNFNFKLIIIITIFRHRLSFSCA